MKSGVKFLVFGNPLVDIDKTPLLLLNRLRKEFPQIEFKEFDPSENLEGEGRDLNIIDTIEGIENVVLFTDIGLIRTSRIFSLHDFDLGYSLKLLKKLGILDSVRIFGVPMKISQRDALSQLSELIRKELF
ncbi:Uncharacterised protein [uncultured archaeon]|nr:Uncharacterised protein [uncultured archaeon]